MTGAVVKIVLAAYMLFILFLSLRPGPMPLPGIWQVDKVYHILAYALMALLWVLAFRLGAPLEKRGSGPTRILCAAFVISTLFGAGMEVFQYFLPLRRADLFDAVANTLGAVAGVVVAGWALKLLARKNSRRHTNGGQK